MPDPPELRSVVEAAEQAAATGEYALAETYLREAVVLQEAGLGPLHPDLANTMNNLGVVCEMADKPDDAEKCYRRAYAIATAAFEPDHPLVATSRSNLEGFYKARGKPLDVPVTRGALAPQPDAQGPSSVGRLRERQAAGEFAAGSRGRSFRPLAIAAAVGVSVLGVVMIINAARPWFGSNDTSGSSPSSVTTPPPTSSSATVPEPVRVEPSPADAKTTAADRGPVEPRDQRSLPPSAPVPTVVTVVTATLCSSLSSGAGEWQCGPAPATVDAGSLFFYTRVRSVRDTTVQHRWYRGDRLQQSVELPVQANPGSGYRTYSRHTMSAERSGDWRVELRTRDGMLLHEQRFTVR